MDAETSTAPDDGGRAAVRRALWPAVLVVVVTLVSLAAGTEAVWGAMDPRLSTAVAADGDSIDPWVGDCSDPAMTSTPWVRTESTRRAAATTCTLPPSLRADHDKLAARAGADADVFHPIERATSTNVYVVILAPSLALGFVLSALVRRALAPDER